MLEARFVTQGRVDPAAVAWHVCDSSDSGKPRMKLSIWWVSGSGPEVTVGRLARAVAQHKSTVGVGVFGLGTDPVTDSPMIALIMEDRMESAVMWLRRFSKLDDDTAQWKDAHGFLRTPAPKVGWFDSKG